MRVGGGLSTDAKIDLMLKLGGVNFIYASTNYLHTLTEALLGRGITPREAFPDMHGLFIAGKHRFMMLHATRTFPCPCQAVGFPPPCGGGTGRGPATN